LGDIDTSFPVPKLSVVSLESISLRFVPYSVVPVLVCASVRYKVLDIYKGFR